MLPGERISRTIKILLPFLILLLIQVAPISAAVSQGLREARVAQSVTQAEDQSTSGDQAAAAEQSQIASQSDAAASALRRVLEHEPWRSELWDTVGRLEMKAGQAAEAIAALGRAEQAGTLSAEGRFVLGDAYLQQGEAQAAEEVWQNLLRLEGPYARVFDRLAQVQRSQKEFPALIATLRAWRAFDPQDAGVAYQLGLQLCAVKPDEAQPLLVEAAQKDTTYTPNVQVLRRGLAQASTHAGGADNAAYGWLMIGRALGSINQWDVAEEAFQQAIAAAPNYAEAWGFLGEARAHLGQTGKTELDRAFQLAPDSPVVKALLAMYWRREGRPSKALEYLEAIAKTEPDEPTWQVEIGNTLVQSGDLTAARASYQKAVDMAPNISLYWQYLAQFSVEYNVEVRLLGLPAARQAVLLAPDDPSALDTLGWALANLGDAASAERFFQRALDKDATYALASLHLGQTYLQQQDPGSAYLYIKRAEKLAGDTPVGQVARRLLKTYYGEGG